MFQTIRRQFNIYLAIAAMVPKEYLAYSIWVWAEFVTQILSLVIYSFFWRAVYGGAVTIAGLTLQQTLNYILLARIFAPLVETRLIFRFGFIIRSGQVVMELLRPIDFQAREYVEAITGVVMLLAQKIPLFLIAWALFGLQFSSDPVAWLVFFVALLMGQSIIFFFDWIFACLAFYSTETWGLSMVKVGLAQFFSGALIPLVMMPGWLQNVAAALPFAQALAVPLGLLSGVTPLADAPRVLWVQFIWLVALGLLSRIVFAIAVRKVTVQGG